MVEYNRVKTQGQRLRNPAIGIAVFPDQHGIESQKEMSWLLKQVKTTRKDAKLMKNEWDELCKQHEHVSDIMTLNPIVEAFKNKWSKKNLQMIDFGGNANFNLKNKKFAPCKTLISEYGKCCIPLNPLPKFPKLVNCAWLHC